MEIGTSSGSIPVVIDKMDFTDVYEHPSPAPYVRLMSRLDYTLPTTMAELYKGIYRLRRNAYGDGPILDVGASFGFNSMLMNYGVSQAALADCLAEPICDDPVVAQRRVLPLLRTDSVANYEILPLDRSRSALAFMQHVGLANEVCAIDLNLCSEEDARWRTARGCALVVSTASLFYADPSAIEKLMRAVAIETRPWVAFSLGRYCPAHDHRAAFDRCGYTLSEILPALWQRCFASEHEQVRLGPRCQPNNARRPGIYTRYFVALPLCDSHFLEQIREDAGADRGRL